MKRLPWTMILMILLTLERVCIVLRKMNVSLSQKAVRIHRLFPLLSSSEPYEFVSLEWLQKWLDESTPTKPIDNHACLCSHDKLHPDKISIMKRISEYAADIFYSRYGGGPRLTGNSRCLICLKKSNAISLHYMIFMIIWPRLCLDLIFLALCKNDLLNQVKVKQCHTWYIYNVIKETAYSVLLCFFS